MKKVEVVAAIIKKDNKYFCAQRNLNKSMGGKWEFPGGKIEINETREKALEREIYEEFNTRIKVNEYVISVEYDYPTFHITMHAFYCDLISGDLELKEHESSRWLLKEELNTLDWADADKPIVERICNSR